jgi:hypothetical protein
VVPNGMEYKRKWREVERKSDAVGAYLLGRKRERERVMRWAPTFLLWQFSSWHTSQRTNEPSKGRASVLPLLVRD